MLHWKAVGNKLKRALFLNDLVNALSEFRTLPWESERLYNKLEEIMRDLKKSGPSATRDEVDRKGAGVATVHAMVDRKGDGVRTVDETVDRKRRCCRDSARYGRQKRRWCCDSA